MKEDLYPVFPGVLLILGTDLAGKDHVANVICDHAEAAGLLVERRPGAFTARPSRKRSTEGKGWLRLTLERLFLTTLPLHCFLIPHLAAILIRRDLRRFQAPASNQALIVVSHTAIRLAAFALGHLFDRPEAIRLPLRLEKALQAIVPHTRAQTLVLDIDHSVRTARLEARQQRGSADFFDRYLAADPARSERIEAILVRLAETRLGGRRLENHDLSEEEIITAISERSPQPDN